MSYAEITEAELHAFVDGELEAGPAARVAGLIEADPALRRRIEAYRADQDQLRRIYAPLIEETLPARLLRPFAAPPTRFRAVWPWAAAGATLAAAAAILLMVSLGVGGAPQDALLAEAIAVRDGAVAPVQQVAANEAPDSLDALVAKTMAADIKVPDLGQAGYALAGLGIYPDRAHGRAIQLSYRNGQGRLLTIYLHQPTGAERYEILRAHGDDRACVVEIQELSVVMLGEMTEQEMYRTAPLTYQPLNL